MRAHFGLPSVRGGTPLVHVSPVPIRCADVPLRARYGQASTYHRQVRDSLLHRQWDPSPVPQDRREERVPSFAVGQVYHAKRRRLQVRIPHIFSSPILKGKFSNWVCRMLHAACGRRWRRGVRR